MKTIGTYCDCVSRASVGLSLRRPVRFCTFYYDCDEQRYVQPGDDIRDDSSWTYRSRRALISYAGARREPHHVPPHRHDFYELVLIRNGMAVHGCSHGERAVSRGDVIILTPNAIHAYSGVDHLVKTNIYVQPDWLLEDLQLLWGERGLVRFLLADALFQGASRDDHLHLRLTDEEVRVCEREVDDLTREATKKEPSLALFNACFLKILCGFNQAFQRHDVSYAAPLPLLKELWSAVTAIEGLISHNQPFQVEKLAEELGLTRFRLHRIFKTTAGMSPMGFYQKRRIQRARRLMEEPGVSVTEVAYRFGFADAAHFGRHFKREMGETPMTYRGRVLAEQRCTESGADLD